VRKKAEATGAFAPVDRRTGKDGKARKQKKRRTLDERDVERDRQACIALDAKVTEATRELAQWLKDHPHYSAPVVANWSEQETSLRRTEGIEATPPAQKLTSGLPTGSDVAKDQPADHLNVSDVLKDFVSSHVKNPIVLAWINASEEERDEFARFYQERQNIEQDHEEDQVKEDEVDDGLDIPACLRREPKIAS
jgi:hypothetical protein